MKIIFLDIDGVVATRQSYSNHRLLEDVKWGISAIPFDNTSVNNLNRIIKSTGAKIVISSSWRSMHSIDELKQMFINEGIIGEIIGTTPNTQYAHSRGREISEWLKLYDASIESFVILDDVPGDIRQMFPKNFVLASMSAGLTGNLAVEAIRILNT